SAFADVVNRARDLSPTDADRFQQVYEQHRSVRVDRARRRVHRALEAAGLSENFNDDPRGAWVYVDKLCGIVGGAADVAEAVLAPHHYLVGERDFKLLPRWWVTAGLPLPDSAVEGYAPAITWRGLVRHRYVRAACLLLILAGLAMSAWRVLNGYPVGRASAV